MYLVVRADGLERSMAQYLRDRIERDPKIEVLLGYRVQELSGDGHLEQITIEDARTGEPRTLERAPWSYSSGPNRAPSGSVAK